VGQDSYAKIVVTKSLDSLAERIESLTTASNHPRAHETLKNMRPLVSQLKSVSGIATIIAPTSPEVGAMIWGSIAMIATASKTSILVWTHFD